MNYRQAAFAAVLTLLVFPITQSAEGAPPLIVGDADGSGAVDMGDVAYVQAALDAQSASTVPFALADVAHPCDGQIGVADLVLIERVARAGSRAQPVLSVCHGVAIGVPKPDHSAQGQAVTLDDTS